MSAPTCRVPGDAAATALNIAANPTLFRLSLVADIAKATIFVFVGVVLYLLLRHVDRRAAGTLVVFVAVGAGMILVNLVFHHAALLVATDPSYNSGAVVGKLTPERGRSRAPGRRAAS